MVQERYRKCRDGVVSPGVEDDHVRHVDHRQRVGAQGALQLEEVRLHEHNEVQAAVVKLLPSCHELAPPLHARARLGPGPVVGQLLPEERNEHSAELGRQLLVGPQPLLVDVRVRKKALTILSVASSSGQISEQLEDLFLICDEALGVTASTIRFVMRALGSKFGPLQVQCLNDTAPGRAAPLPVRPQQREQVQRMRGQSGASCLLRRGPQSQWRRHLARAVVPKRGWRGRGATCGGPVAAQGSARPSLHSTALRRRDSRDHAQRQRGWVPDADGSGLRSF
mmetsp:Transcript_161037/g.516910  ORF Transcript_161037/g.516910 Transcript_161037/m.516910 type:complete len:281 (+) Transcript_161037:723-1565(+)